MSCDLASHTEMFKKLFLKVLDQTLPVIATDMSELSTSPVDGSMRLTWVGHATVLVQFDGISVLADPMFSKNASPMPFCGLGRYRPVPFQIKDIPKVRVILQ